MSNYFGAHLVKSAYGLWLPDDERGHWSTAWDPQQGYVEPHQLHLGDPRRRHMAQALMQGEAKPWSRADMNTIRNALKRCAAQSDWSMTALTVEPTHFHLLNTVSEARAESTCKWLSQQLTKAIRAKRRDDRPVFAKGRWITLITDETHWERTVAYINRHPGAVKIGAD